MKCLEKLFEAKYGRSQSYYVPATNSGNQHLAKVNKEQWGLLFLMYLTNEPLSGHISSQCGWCPSFGSLMKLGRMLLFGFDLKHGGSEKKWGF